MPAGDEMDERLARGTEPVENPVDDRHNAVLGDKAEKTARCRA